MRRCIVWPDVRTSPVFTAVPFRPGRKEELAMTRMAKTSCTTCPQRRAGILAGVPDEVMNLVERRRTLQTFRPGHELFGEGGPALAVHCLHEGLVKLTMAGDGGEELVLEFCRAGRLLGLRAALADEPYEATATAIETSSVCTIPRDALEQVFERSPASLRAATRTLAREVHAAHLRLMEVVQRSVPQRVAHALVVMQETAENELRVRRSDMAHLVGTTPETLSRVLHGLESRGAIAVTRAQIRVKDAPLLRRIARLQAAGE
jgi:CRP/FNR family transcriptional regulator